MILTRFFNETSEALGGSRANPAKKREIEDNSRKIGALFTKLNNGDISKNASEKLVQLCQSLDNGDFGTALQIQVQLTTSDWDECNFWLATLKRIIKSQDSAKCEMNWNVVVHTELSSTCGHYYCFVRCAQEVWYKFDDSKVARVGEDFVLSQEAYILFYAKQGTPWFSSFLETEKSYLDQYKSNHPPKSVLDNTDRICTSSPNVTSNCYSEFKKAREEVVGVSVESFNGYRNGVQGNEAEADPPSLFTPAPLVMSSSPNGTSDKVEKKFSPSVLKENKCNQEFNEIKNSANITLSMPLRSPSPDIYAEEAPVSSYSIPRDHLMPEKQVPCKRKLDEDLEDSRRKQAAFKLLKNMPNDRSSKLLAAMNGSHDLVVKKIRRKELPSNRNNRASSTSHKPNLDSFLRPVAAGSLR